MRFQNILIELLKTSACKFSIIWCKSAFFELLFNLGVSLTTLSLEVHVSLAIQLIIDFSSCAHSSKWLCNTCLLRMRSGRLLGNFRRLDGFWNVFLGCVLLRNQQISILSTKIYLGFLLRSHGLGKYCALLHIHFGFEFTVTVVLFICAVSLRGHDILIGKRPLFLKNICLNSSWELRYSRSRWLKQLNRKCTFDMRLLWQVD